MSAEDTDKTTVVDDVRDHVDGTDSYEESVEFVDEADTADESIAVVDEQAVAVEYEGPGQARLYLSRIDPWAVLKTAFVISIGLAIVIVVAVVLVWGILAALGVFSTVNEAVESVAGASSSVFDVVQFFSFGRVLGTALVLAVLNVVLVTLLACLFAFMYNLTVPFTRGIEITLTEE